MTINTAAVAAAVAVVAVVAVVAAATLRHTIRTTLPLFL